MKLFLKLLFQSKVHWQLMLFTFLAMVFMTLASQMEIVTIGVLTQKSAGFFELFSSVEEGRLQDAKEITHHQLEERWRQIDTDNKGYITPDDTTKFLKSIKRKNFVDTIISKVEEVLPLSNNVRNLAIMVTIVGILKALSLFWHRYSTQLVAIRVSRDLRQAYFEHIQKLPMSFYQKHDIGSLSARVVSDANAIADGLNSALINYLQTPFTALSTMVLCFAVSWRLSLVIFFGIPAIIYPIVVISRKVRRMARQLQKNQESFASVLIDFLAGIQTVKIFSMEDFSLKKYVEQNDEMAKLERRTARYGVAARPIVHTIGMFFLATTLLYGLYVLHMTISELFVYAGFLIVFYEPVKKFAEVNTNIQRGIAAAERMDEVLQIQPDIQDKSDAVPLQEFNDSLEFRNVWFKYDKEWILQDLSFTVRKGETVAIVGPTGAGKSTIVQLLPRLYDINEGAILIDSRPITDYTQASLRDAISFVPQRPFLFQDTVAQNIAYGKPYSEADVQGAARQAHAEEFILKLPRQYQTPIAEGGKDLSGGQQQRLAISRALVKRAPILIMDEATSSLDTISEGYIKSAIRQLHGKVTQIIIAHRLTTIEGADRIIYLEGGKVIAQGTKEELLQTCPQFRTLWEQGTLVS